jgi:hypothetical protein
MGLGSFGISIIRAPVWLRGEARKLSKRLNIWEKMAVIEDAGVVIGIMEGRQIWSNRSGIPADRAAGSAL